MLEERLFLILSYLLIASLLILFCFFTPFTRKIKLTGILIVSAFYFVSWNSYINILGWPSTEDLPDKFRISWVVIQEPSKGDREEGGLYLWVRKLNEVNTPYGMPRSYKLNWNEENHKVAQSALHKYLIFRKGSTDRGKVHRVEVLQSHIFFYRITIL